ncbi:MAG: DNRLRE domain-containing protein, partial [Methanosarcinales archaeon]|nr:DNRLRE domain-containing protein [Methanosarcinales archaeon]
DNRLREDSPNTVLDKTTWIDVGKIENSNYHGVIWFDLSQYNSTDQIETATLSLLWYYENREQSTQVGIYRPADWNPQYVTWSSCADSVEWNNQGGNWYDKTNTGQGTQPYGTISFSYGNGPDNQYHDFDVTELVQAYVDGTYKNNGFFIRADDVNNGYIAFYSSDSPNTDQQPKLTVTLKEEVEETPDLNPIGNKSVDINSLLEFTITATDLNDDALTYSVTGLPGGASFDPSTATFSWTPGEGQEGSYQVHVEVTDGFLVDSEEITIRVNKKDAQVVLNGIDNRMREVSPNTVLGATTWIDVGKIGPNNYKSVLWFDLSQIKSTDLIESATLSLLWYYDSRDQNTEVGIYRPVEWDTDYVAWNTHTNGVNWDNPGGDWYDRNNAAQGAEAYDTVIFLQDTSPDGQYHNFDVTQLVQSYVDGTYENTGLLIKADEEDDGYIAFRSSDWSDADQHPKLIITYTP